MGIIDNIVPYIESEESKIETEACKILGSLILRRTGLCHSRCEYPQPVIGKHNYYIHAIASSFDHFRLNDFPFYLASPSSTATPPASPSAFATRPPPNVLAVEAALQSYISEPQTIGCYSAPAQAIIVHKEPTRPQPRPDRNAERGYAVGVGRVREDESGIFDIKFVALSHNTTIGAAGRIILNCEAAILKGYC